VPSISVFTASHKPTYLDDAYASLADQSLSDWEWILVLNGGCRWRPPEPDDRVRIFERDDLPARVGAVKRAAVAKCRGDVLVELDHDDVLVHTALRAVLDAFDTHPDAALVYSDCAQIGPDGKRDDTRFDERHGWRYDDVTVEAAPFGTLDVLRCQALQATPHNVGLIWYAPNHVRAFARAAYDVAGGYDDSRYVLDDQDLMARLYRVGSFVHIPEVLYLQRWHPGNTQVESGTNAQIQVDTVNGYESTISDLGLAWCKRTGLLPLDLGAAHNEQPGYLGVDMHEGPGVHLVGDVFDVLAEWPDNSVGIVRAFDFLEHVETRDKVRLLNEIHRVLAHGGLFLTMTPSTDGRGAWQDPTHVSGWNENSWWYFTDEQYAAFVPEITARFQVGSLRTMYPSEFHRAHLIPYVLGFLVADKGVEPRQGGLRLGR
jgi:SAM-dependent methyltransferase